MKVCRTLRHAALEYFAFKNPRVDDLDHFLAYMRRHRLPPKTVRSLHLSNVSLDATLVREIAQLFPNLESLTLVDISCIPPLPRNHHPQSDPETTPPVPMPLNSLTLSCKRPRRDSGWSLSGMMHILSLLAPSELTVWMGHGVSFRDTFDPSCLAASPATVWDLDVGFTGTPKKSAIATVTVLDALSRTLAPGALQSVEVRYDSKAALRAPGTLLARIGSNVTNLAIHPPAPSELEERHQTWTDPFDGESRIVSSTCGIRLTVKFFCTLADWTLLDIRGCEKLERLYLSLNIRPLENLRPQRALCHVAAGLLAYYARLADAPPSYH